MAAFIFTKRLRLKRQLIIVLARCAMAARSVLVQDEKRECAECAHPHDYGILRYSVDGVPIYGGRRCWCGCSHFVERNIEAEQKFLRGEDTPRDTQVMELKEIWAATSFLNAQVPLATRIAVREINGLMAATDLSPSLSSALTEFASLVISQVTDIRGAMTRSENKFAHLVAHTDEIVEAMRGVTQLAERLNTIYGAISQIQQQQAKTEHDIAGIAAVLKTLVPAAVEIKEAKPSEWVLDEIDRRHMFVEKIGSLRNEPIITRADPDDE